MPDQATTELAASQCWRAGTCSVGWMVCVRGVVPLAAWMWWVGCFAAQGRTGRMLAPGGDVAASLSDDLSHQVRTSLYFLLFV